ncbi:CoA transferase [Sinomonas flava]|uniref:CoA transferase n=1 Tax=Sinomonas flava TaxID=496857 RepID=UPI0039A4A892
MHDDLPPGLLDLRRHLAPVVDPLLSPEGWWDGPRRWWGGPLDVEGLALGSVGALIAALAALDGARGARRRAATSAAGVAASFDSIRHLRVDGRALDIWAPMSGFHPTADGWVRLHANYPHHAQRLLAAVGIASPDHLGAALLEQSALDVEATVRAAGGVAAAVRPGGEWAASSAGQAAAGEPWMRFSLAGADPVRPLPQTDAAGLPLAGVRVLDLTRVIAGPSATRLLGALGADVLRVDPPQHPELPDAHLDTDFAKRSAVADLREAEQLLRVRALAGEADVVFLGYRQAALARFGLDADALRADFPHLAVVALNAWGWDGPWADGRGFDSIVQAACGIAHLYGTPPEEGTHDGAQRPPGWRPGALPVQALDHATGMGMAAAAVGLLAARGRGTAGSARLSLIATANELLGAAPPEVPDPQADLPAPRNRAESPYGTLDFVPPPLLLDGAQLAYPRVPGLYGSSPLAWGTGA